MRSASAPLVLAGYFGFGNAGDDLIAAAVRGAASSLPWRTLGVDASRWNPLSLAALFRSSRALVYGGGELFQTRTSRRSLLYYALLPRLARLCGSRFVAYGMGLDPSLPPAALAAAVRTLDRAERVWFRDDPSLTLYHSAGGRAPSSVSPDPVWSGPVSDGPPPSHLRRVLWIPRDPLRQERLEALSSRAGGSRGILLLHPTRDAREFGGLAGLESWKGPEEILPLIEAHDAVVSMRYHGLVLAALAGRPAVALSAHPKVSALAGLLGFPVLSPDAGAGEVSRALAEAFDRRKDLLPRVRDLQSGARRGLDDLRRFLENL